MAFVNCVFTASLTSGATLSDEVDIGQSWGKVYLQIPTMASGSLYVHASPETGGTFTRVVEEKFNTATAHADFVINSSVTQRIVPIPVHGCRFLKIENTSGATDVTTTFKIICSD